MSITHPIEEGARVRITRDVIDLSSGVRRLKGWEFVVEEFWAASDNPDPQPGDIDVDFYNGSAAGGLNNVCVPADAVEQVMSAAEMGARKMPTATKLRDAVSLDIRGSFASGFTLWETDRDGERALEVYGETDEGLPFGFRVTVSDPWHVDG